MTARLCSDCVHCRECGNPAFCLADRPDTYPCPHGERLCGDPDCLAACPDCRADMFAEAIATGVYSDAADPLTVKPVETEAEYRERTRLRGFDTTTNSYRRDAS